MSILVLGSGAREHAIAAYLAGQYGQMNGHVEHIAGTPEQHAVYLAPGNALAAQEMTCLPVDILSIEAVLQLVQRLTPELVVIGPESPLQIGLSDALRQHGCLVVGPSQMAARLETSKVYAKRAMRQAGVKTADFVVIENESQAQHYFSHHRQASVVKADGLMAGKGVFMCDDGEQGLHATQELLQNGQQQVLVEERLQGHEASLIACCMGTTYRLFPLARDYKRIGTGDTGKNTGGMGAYTPVDSREDLTELGRQAIVPILQHQMAIGYPFYGWLYAGLLFHQNTPYVLEYNVRLGDPEAQVLLGCLAEDQQPLFKDMAMMSDHGPSTHTGSMLLSRGASVCVVLAAPGYPEQPQIGGAIEGVEQARLIEGVSVFGAGVCVDEQGVLRVNGGRVLSVVGQANTVEQARKRAYQAVCCIHFAGMQVREDIAQS